MATNDVNNSKLGRMSSRTGYVANSVVNAYYSSGAFREVGFMEFAVQYLEYLKSAEKIVNDSALSDEVVGEFAYSKRSR